MNTEPHRIDVHNHMLSAEYVRELVGPGQILFGTDYPFAPEILTAETVKGLQAYDGFSAEDLNNIEYGNAALLFPRLS